MRRRSGYLVKETGGRDRWMVSYTDIMTILLILFVAVAAKAVQTPPKPMPKTRDASGDVLREAKTVLESRGIRPSLEARGLVISLPQAILYPSGEDQVSPAALPLIGQIAGVLRNLPNKVTLVGHADPVPIHNSRFRNNWELSAARSLRLLELLTSHYDIAESRLAVSSLGSYSPRSSNSTAEGRAENRRVEIVIVNETPAS
jgi:chemotaxis protein MotB